MVPTYLFDTELFKRIFWPGFWQTKDDNPIWYVLNIPCTTEFEQESGQILIDKTDTKVVKALTLAVYMQSKSDCDGPSNRNPAEDRGGSVGPSNPNPAEDMVAYSDGPSNSNPAEVRVGVTVQANPMQVLRSLYLAWKKKNTSEDKPGDYLYI